MQQKTTRIPFQFCRGNLFLSARIILVTLWILGSLSIGCANGQELETFGIANPAARNELVSGNLKVTLSSRDPINLLPLVEKLSEADSIEDAYAKIDRVRKRLYATREILLEIENLDASLEVCSVIDLKKKIVWFNSQHVYNSGWVAKDISSGAACCVVKVRKGIYDHYFENPNGSWKFGGTTKAGGLWTATTYGSYLYRGFKGIAKSTETNRADIVMYFYQ